MSRDTLSPGTPERLGRWTILRTLGREGAAWLYAATDPLVRRNVMIRAVRKSETGESATGLLRMYQREAEVAHRLDHPGIVRVHYFGAEGDASFIVTEFIEGRSLRAKLDAEGHATPREAIHIVRAVLDALAHAHAAGVIHRDVQPRKIFVDAQGYVMLADFGFALVRGLGAGSTEDFAASMAPAPAVMAPEMIFGESVDARSDLFAVGAVLYELVTGQPPYAGPGSWTVTKQIIGGAWLPPTSVLPGLPPVLDDVLAKALARKPEDRYASAAEFSAELARVRDLLPP